METDNAREPKDPWEWPRWMLSAILAVHDNAELLITGLTRRAATRLTRWLWGAEVVVRRLLLALALKLPLRDLARRERAVRHADRPPPEGTPGPRASFRTFAFRSASSAATNTQPALPRQPRAAPRPGFGVLPLDPLLALGPAVPPPRNPKRSPRPARRYGPLHMIQTEEDYERALLGETPAGHVTRSETPPAHAIRPDPRDTNRGGRPPFKFLLPGPFDDETLRPAPRLAARISALIRVIDDPLSAAWRLTTMLARRAGAAASLSAAEPPCLFEKPHGPLQPTPGLTERLLAHKALAAAAAGFNDSS